MFRFSSVSGEIEPQSISVIVAARNEESNIEKILNYLLAQSYPQNKYEVIVVSDRSEDATVEIVKKYSDKYGNIKIFSIPNGEKGGKKRALSLGVKEAKYSILAFTDADCLPKPEWLNEINRHFTKDTDIVVGYSPLLSKQNRLFMKLKNLERTSIFAVSAGSLGWNYGVTCTGRNFSYRKKLFQAVGGFAGIEDIPSGDDDLLLQRMNKKAKKMQFLFNTNSFVPSFDEKDFVGQVNLETRRASKWRFYPPMIQMLTALVFLYYVAFVLVFSGAVIGKVSWSTFLELLSIKVIAELLILTTFTVKIRQTPYLIYYPLALIIHLPYFIFFALKGTFGKYRWK
jgi:glycosyltransferase involved in cell wall biosynthesis